MENSDALLLEFEGWEKVGPDDWGFTVGCSSRAAFETLPEWLMIRGERFHRVEWRQATHVALYQNWDKLLTEVALLM